MLLINSAVALLAFGLYVAARADVEFAAEKTILSDIDVIGFPEIAFGSELPVAMAATRFGGDTYTRKCKVQPGDGDWPTESQWGVLERVVSERMFSKPLPVAAPCYAGRNYDKDQCDKVIAGWDDSDFHDEHPSSIMFPLFTGLACLPTTNSTFGTCTQGTYPVYVVSARTVRDVQASVNFARNKNVRLVVKNTGHDFAGKSSGKGSLSVRTHLLNETAFIAGYKSHRYTGPAFKVGSGVQGRDIFATAKRFGYAIVGGEGATVGYAGGYVQGGGHSPLGSILGMGADSVLSMDVVMSNGRFVTASPENHPDLYWALCGGGGSTFGVVTSITVKAHKDMPVTISQFNWTASARDMQAVKNGDLERKDFWEVVKVYFSLFPEHADKGIYSYWNIVVLPDGGISFLMAPFFAPRLSAAEVAALLSPVLEKAKEFSITIDLVTTSFDNYHDAWKKGFPQERVGGWNVYPGSRLFPRENFEDKTKFEATWEAIKNEANIGTFPIIAFNIAPTLAAGGNPDNSVNPAWRETVMHAITGIGWDEGIRDLSRIAELQKDFTNNRMQKWRDVAPGSGCYLGETDINEPNHQQAFWGTNYPRLYGIKQGYDPVGVFFAETSVGSEDWTTGFWRIGPLCRV